MKIIFPLVSMCALAVLVHSCGQQTTAEHEGGDHEHHHEHQHYDQPKRPQPAMRSSDPVPLDSASKSGMKWIEGGQYTMGAVKDERQLAREDEFPPHPVKVDGFWIGVHEVTNEEFAAFVEATGYVTVAEIKPDWEVLKKEVPPGTPKPHDSLLVAGSMIFVPSNGPIPLHDWSLWWGWQPGADWQHPQGPETNIEGKENHPVVQVCWFDAQAYCKWKNGRLPTEAEWEWAARGGLKDAIYPWGDEPVGKGHIKANSWQGRFPFKNEQKDGYYFTAPVMNYEPNGYGLYDMAGNVWEWCSDWFHSDHYTAEAAKGLVVNPQGPDKSFDKNDVYAQKRSQRGGSFLCSDEYCASYRVSARMPGGPDTGMPHVGFRCVCEADAPDQSIDD